MKRREFIALLGGAAAAATPRAAWAQSPDGMRRLGILMSGAQDDEAMQERVTAFRRGLQELGWTVGRNIRIDERWGGNELEHMEARAAELVALKPDAIMVQAGSALQAVQRQTRTIPVVFALIPDPVGSGFVASLARPGGNATGFTPAEFSLGGKWLEVLKEIAPAVARVAVLVVPDLPPQMGIFRAIEEAAPSFNIHATFAGVRNAGEIEHVIKSFAQKPNGGLIVSSNTVTNAHRKLIIELAARHRLPAVYSFRFFVADGGLASYGADISDMHRGAAGYIDRILKGERPADLPVQQPTKFTLVLNLKAAKQIGLTVSPTMLARADEVIE